FSVGGHAVSEAQSAALLFVGHLCEVLFLFGAAGLIVRTLLNDRALTFDSIFGAVCGYIFLGIAWATLYSMIESFRPGSLDFSRHLTIVREPPPALPQVLIYYIFVTRTTVGYGDVAPASPMTCTLAWMESI